MSSIKLGSISNKNNINIIVGTYDGSLLGYNTEGEEIFSFSIGDFDIRHIVEDKYGNIYVSYGNIYVVNEELDGATTYLSSPTTNNTYEFDIDANGNFYTASSSGYTTKIDSGDNVLWSYNHGEQVLSVAVNQDGNCFSTSAFDNSFIKHDLDGSKEWEFFGPSDSVRAVTCDEYGFSYCAARDNSVTKVDSSGSQVWRNSSIIPSGRIEDISVDIHSNVYVASYGDRIVKLGPDGNILWAFGNSNFNKVSVDREGNVYGLSIASNKLYAITSDGQEKWNKDIPSIMSVYSSGNNVNHR